MRRWFLLLFVTMLISIPLLAQEDESTAAFVRAAHFAADVSEVDIYVNGDLTLEAVAFPAVSDWLEVDPGTYTVDIVATGGVVEDAVLSGEYDLGAGDWTTLAVVGEANRDTLTIQPTIEDLSNITDGLTYVSVFHAIADLDPVNIFVDEIELVRLLSFPGSLEESDGYAGDAITPGEYVIEARDTAGTVLASIEPGLLGAGRAYFVALVGTAADPVVVFVPTDVESITMSDMDEMEQVEVGDGTAQVRIGHFSVSAPDVDIYLNGELLLEAVAFGDITDEYLEVDAGFYEVALVPTGEALENAAYSGELPVVTDTVTLIAALGFPEDGSLTVVAVDEGSDPIEPGFSRIAMFQTIPGLDGYDLNANGDLLIQSLSYPAAFDGAGDGYVAVDIVAGAYEFVISSDNINLNVGNVTTGAGRVYLIVPSGTEASPIFFLISSDFPAEEE